MFLAASLFVWGAAFYEKPTLTVAIQPFGAVPARSVAAVQAGIRRQYDVAVVVLKPLPLPKSAYYPPRKRYRADKLLNTLKGTPGEYDKVIGVTTADISTTSGKRKDWGVMGLGYMPGRSCVVSSYRLKRPGRKPPTLRLSEVAIHEIGHTLGLPHCPTLRCVMEDAKGSIKTVDASTGKLCRGCRARIAGTVVLR